MSTLAKAEVERVKHLLWGEDKMGVLVFLKLHHVNGGELLLTVRIEDQIDEETGNIIPGDWSALGYIQDNYEVYSANLQAACIPYVQQAMDVWNTKLQAKSKSTSEADSELYQHEFSGVDAGIA